MTLSVNSLSGKVLLTGAASGIGRACAVAASGAGAETLILVDQNGEDLEVTASLCGNVGTRLQTMSVDDPDAWTELESELAGLSHGIICAGISDAATIADMTFQEWRKVLSVNLDGAFLSLQAMLRKIEEGGSIVAIGSATGSKAAQMTAAYGASKAGLAQLVRVAALEVAARRIRVNAVAPGGVKTPMFSNAEWFAMFEEQNGGTESAWQALAEQTPLGRFAEPEEIANLVLFLLSDQANTMTGTVLDCDGGYGL